MSCWDDENEFKNFHEVDQKLKNEKKLVEIDFKLNNFIEIKKYEPESIANIFNKKNRNSKSTIRNNTQSCFT
jgi:hypothetical protein